MNKDLKTVKQQPEKISGRRNSKCKGPEVGLTKSIVTEAVGAGPHWTSGALGKLYKGWYLSLVS